MKKNQLSINKTYYRTGMPDTERIFPVVQEAVQHKMKQHQRKKKGKSSGRNIWTEGEYWRTFDGKGWLIRSLIYTFVYIRIAL